jgi:hypothetical protein
MLCAALFAALSIVFAGAGSSFACSCVSGDPATSVESAEIVVAGSAVEVVPAPNTAVISSLDPTTYHLGVDTAYQSDLIVTMDEDAGDGDDALADWAWPIALVAGASLVLLTGALWVRYLRS